MRERGFAIVVLVLALVGGGIWWFTRDSDTPATPASTQRGSNASVERPSAPAATGSLVVTVRSAKGPLGNATVRIAPEDGDVIVVRTGADGVARASQLAPGRYAISGSATGHQPAASSAQLAAGQAAELAITLVAGGRTLSGVVSDVSGGPIAGARIDAAKLGGGVRPEAAIATTATGADGKYQLTVAEGQLLVAARSADYAPQSRIVEIGEAGATADFALVPGGVIEGIVRDAQSKQPVPGALVEARRDSPAMALAETAGQRALAGADGRFRLTGLRPGAYELGARHQSLRTKAPTLVGIGVAEQVSDVELLVGIGPVVRGKVVDESQAAVAGANIAILSARGGDDVTSDAKGEFVIAGLAPGNYALVATNDKYLAAGPSRVKVAEQDVDGIVVRVERGIELRGHVEPRQICDVSFEPSLEGRGGQGPALDRMMRRSGDGPTTTGPDGDFTIVAGAGAATLSARCPSGDQGSQQVAVKPAMAPVTLAVAPGGSIAGRVLDGAGKPVANVSVMASLQGDAESVRIVNGVITSGVQALTTASGTYEIRGLRPGTYRLGVLDRGRPMRMPKPPAEIKLAAAATKTGVDLVVDRPTGVIKGIVLGPDGKPLADAWVSLTQDLEAMLDGAMPRPGEDGPGQARMVSVERSDDGGGDGGGGFPPALTGADGTFEIVALPHATFDVMAEAQAGKLRGRVENVKPDATVEIRALGVTSLAGKVTGPKGPPALFTVELVGPTRAQRSFTDGSFSFSRVDPGDYVVRVTSSDGNGEGKVTVAAARPATLDVVLVANAIVIGRLVDGAGNPLPGLPVAVIPESPDGRVELRLEGPPLTSAPDGTFRIEHEAGPSMLLVLTPPRPTTQRGLKLEAGKTLDVGEIRVVVGQPPPP